MGNLYPRPGGRARRVAGMVTWHLRVFADQDHRIETYESVIPDDPPETCRIGEVQAMRDAMAAWSVQD
jgi:hypothetical protein